MPEVVFFHAWFPTADHDPHDGVVVCFAPAACTTANLPICLAVSPELGRYGFCHPVAGNL